jgi:hypothetical protein
MKFYASNNVFSPVGLSGRLWAFSRAASSVGAKHHPVHSGPAARRRGVNRCTKICRCKFRFPIVFRRFSLSSQCVVRAGCPLRSRSMPRRICFLKIFNRSIDFSCQFYRDCNLHTFMRISTRQFAQTPHSFLLWLQFQRSWLVTCAQRKENDSSVMTITSINIVSHPLCSCVVVLMIGQSAMSAVEGVGPWRSFSIDLSPRLAWIGA